MQGSILDSIKWSKKKKIPRYAISVIVMFSLELFYLSYTQAGSFEFFIVCKQTFVMCQEES